MDRNLVAMIEDFERDFPGWNWLIRSDADGGYFANILSPDSKQFVDPKSKKLAIEGVTFPTSGDTKEEAFEKAVTKLQKVRDDLIK